MGVVLRATDTEARRQVAIKIISPLVTQDQDLLRRFVREMKVMNILNHPGIVRLLDAQTAPVPYYAMEYYGAPTLATVMKEHGAFESRRALDIGLQIARALEYAHRQGVVHRDIKPENVLVGPDDLIKLVDFGIAVLAGASSLTKTGQAPGTVGYMAPEQFRGEPVGPAADVYAVGLLIHEMVNGVPAHDKDDLCSQLVTGPPPLPADPLLGGALSDLVQAMAAREPGDRPAIGEVVERLNALRAQLELA
jgi:serine/threonine-protein kinase